LDLVGLTTGAMRVDCTWNDSPLPLEEGILIMADEEFDFTSVQAKAVTRLKPRKIVPVPDTIVKLAQQSFDGVPGPEETTLHVLEHRFESEERASKFAEHMRHAGDHTSPVTSVTALIDPDESGDKRIVRWRAGARRGRGASA
jgi:hypothetical protein